MISNDIAKLFEGDPSDPKPMSLRQGVVQEWDPATGENSIQIAGATLVNIPALTGESVALVAGDVVALLTTGDSWLLIGKVTTPGDPGTVPTWVGDITALAPLVPLAGVTDGLVMTGATNASDTPGTGPRVVINDPAYPGEIVLYTDEPDELEPARIKPVVSGSVSYLRFFGAKTTIGDAPATVNLVGNSGTSIFEVDADVQHIFGTDTTIDGFSSLRLGDGSNYIKFSGHTIDAETGPLALIGTGATTSNGVPVVTTTGTQALTNKDLSSGTNTLPTSVVTLTGSQTVTNKDLSSGTNTFPGRMLTQNLAAACTANVGLTTTEVDITGATVTFTTTKANATYLVTGSFYFAAASGAVTIASGKLNVDGTNRTAFAQFTGTSATTDRVSGSQTWTGTLASAGSHTLKLRGVAGASGVTVNDTHTTITVMVFE